MRKSKLISKLVVLSAGLALMASFGVVNSVSNTAQAATVTATKVKLLEGHNTMDDDGRELMPIDEYLDKTASWNTAPNPYKLNGRNNIKFKWYKKAKVRNAWDNTDTIISQAVNAITQSTSATGGQRPVMGEATVNGVHYYIMGDTLEQEMIFRGARDLMPKEYFEQPKLGYMTKSVQLYFATDLSSKYDGSGEWGILIQEGNKALKHHTIVIPSHHEPVELFGTKYVPIIFKTEYGVTSSDLMKYSDFQKYVASGEGHSFSYNGVTNYQKNGHVYAKDPDAYKAAKIETRKLKSAKRRRSYEKRIISDLKNDAQGQHKYALNV